MGFCNFDVAFAPFARNLLTFYKNVFVWMKTHLSHVTLYYWEEFSQHGTSDTKLPEKGEATKILSGHSWAIKQWEQQGPAAKQGWLQKPQVKSSARQSRKSHLVSPPGVAQALPAMQPRRRGDLACRYPALVTKCRYFLVLGMCQPTWNDIKHQTFGEQVKRK